MPSAIPTMKGETHCVHQDSHAGGILRDHDRRRLLQSQACLQRRRLRAGRSLGRSLADGLCLRHVLFLGGHLRGLCRPVRVALRHRVHLDRAGQRLHRFAAGLGDPGPPHPHHDPAAVKRHHAGIPGQALRQQRPEDRRVGDHIHLPDSLHRVAVQRPVPPVRHGFQHRLHGVHHTDGRADRRVRHRRRLHGYSHQRLHPGHHHAVRYRGRHRSGAEGQRRLHAGHLRHGEGQRSAGLRRAWRVRFVFRARSLQPVGRGDPHFPGYMGPAPDGAEVLRHQVGKCHLQGHDHLHLLRGCRGRWLLLPGRLWQTVHQSDGDRSQRCARWRLRRHRAQDAGNPVAAADRRCGDPRPVGVDVHAVLAGAGLKFHADA